jgi:TonB family protein
MIYDRPHYRRTSAPRLGGYGTRVLIGFLCSLSLLLVLFHLPIESTTDRVGWSPRSVELIPLTAVESQDEPADRSTSAERGAPPPTRFTPPQAEASTADTEAPSDEGTDEETSTQEEDASSRVRSIAALSIEDHKPEIVGGMGALYLQIQYPAAAQRKGIEGLLELEFIVDREGNVRDIAVARSLHPLCDSAAVRALRSVQFTPAKQDGTPIPIRMSLPVRFQLRSDSTAPQSNRLPDTEG